MGNQTLMAIGAHADNIELNVGGTLAKYREMGYDVVYVMSTNNMSGGWSKLRPDTPTILTAHEDKTAVRKLAELMLKHKPEAVMTHGPVMVDMEHVGTCMPDTGSFKIGFSSPRRCLRVPPCRNIHDLQERRHKTRP